MSNTKKPLCEETLHSAQLQIRFELFILARNNGNTEFIEQASSRLLESLNYQVDCKAQKERNREVVAFWVKIPRCFLSLLRLDKGSGRLCTPTAKGFCAVAYVHRKLRNFTENVSVTLFPPIGSDTDRHRLQIETSSDGKVIKTSPIIGCHIGDAYGGSPLLVYITRNGSVYSGFCPDRNNQPPTTGGVCIFQND
jgi:hypothetical protein